MKRETAETICSMIDAVFNQLQNVDSYVRSNCDSTQSDKFRRAVFRCVSELDLDVLEPIYKAFPDLKPSFLS